MGQVEIFEITFDTGHAVYREGDRVTGNVKIQSLEDVKYKAFFIELYGIGLVHGGSTENQQEDLDPNEIKGNFNKEQYFHKKITLSEKDGSLFDKHLVLQSGEHKFPFECKLPPELPSSFEGQYGQIRYLARAWLERPWKSNVVTKKAFTVLSGLDLNFIPEAAALIEICKYKQLGGCCGTGSVTIEWSVKRSGFVPGQDIWVQGAIQNESKETVAYSKATLYMVVDYKSKKRRKKERREISYCRKEETASGDVTLWQDPVHIPPVPPTGLSRSRLIDINYELEFKVLIERCQTPIVYVKDLYIGTVPMCRREMKSCIAGMFNQPYADSTEDLKQGSSQLSLTRIIAAASTEHPTASPTAPTLATLERGMQGVSLLPMETTTVERPPPFAPGHAGGQQQQPPSASCQDDTLDDASLQESYMASIWGPVSIREAADDQESLRGEFTYAPVYSYYSIARTPKGSKM